MNSLLDKYENSLLYTGQNQRKQSIEFPVKKSTLPEYFDETSMQFELVHAQLADMEEKGFVRLIWRKGKEGHILESVCCRQNVRKKLCMAAAQNQKTKGRGCDSYLPGIPGQTSCVGCFFTVCGAKNRAGAERGAVCGYGSAAGDGRTLRADSAYFGEPDGNFF